MLRMLIDEAKLEEAGFVIRNINGHVTEYNLADLLVAAGEYHHDDTTGGEAVEYNPDLHSDPGEIIDT